jgi:hypothetical protein
MHDEQTVQRFIELRASGWTYARLMTEFNVSKPKLIYPIEITIVSPSLPRSGEQGWGEEARFSSDSPRPDLHVSTCKPQHLVTNVIFGFGQRPRYDFAPLRLCVEAVSRRAPRTPAKSGQNRPKVAMQLRPSHLAPPIPGSSPENLNLGVQKWPQVHSGVVAASLDLRPSTAHAPRISQFRCTKVAAGARRWLHSEFYQRQIENW